MEASGSARKQLETAGIRWKNPGQVVGGQESYINRGPKSTLEKPDFNQ